MKSIPHLLLEPGRSIIAPAGALITPYTVSGMAAKRIVDAAMNDLIRPVTLPGAA